MTSPRSRTKARGRRKRVYRFTLVLVGASRVDQALEDALFEAGCDDAILGTRNGVLFLEFDREGSSLPDAVLSAIQDVERVKGVDVIRVEPDDIVNASEIARRTGRTREGIRLLASGMRGPGSFPPPVHGLRRQAPLWRWAEVAEWMRAYTQGTAVPADEVEAASFIAVMNGALRMHQVVRQRSVLRALWRAMDGWRSGPGTPRPGWFALLERLGRR